MTEKSKDDPIGTITITFEDGKTQVIRNIRRSLYETMYINISPYGAVSNVLKFESADGVCTSVANKGVRSMTWRPKRQK